jgi:hypothetical protein
MNATILSLAQRGLYTTILAYVIAVLGLIMIVGGVWGLFHLFLESARIRIPLRYYGMAIGMICGGFGLGGIAQVCAY